MRFLDKIASPADLKKLTMTELNALSGELRNFLIQSVSKTGGHLASNLGVVELTIALHLAYESPIDKIVWDVGHQCYPHKILTGRREIFNTLRQFGGVSGFVKSAESPHDAFDAGHSSTSLSVAHGMAVSRDLLGENHRIVAVIGDGAMTSGLALEAMNNIGRSNSNILVVLNDNQMSISENVGALASHLSDMRTKPAYISVKRDIKSILQNFPTFGNRTANFIENVKTKMKYILLPGVLFEELGLKYYGPVDGHNLRELSEVLESLKEVSGPVLLHVITKKGKGYAPAERESLKFHGVEPFDIPTGIPKNLCIKKTYTEIFANKITRIGHENNKVVAITAAMPTGVGFNYFQEHFANRFFDVGIAESHAVTFAAGMAKSGLLPVVAIYSTFLQRAYDQIIHDVCIQKLPVVFILDRGGVVPADGETHQGIFDISYLSHMPNMTIMSPKDGTELEDMLDFALKLGTPVAVRYPKDVFPEISTETNPIELGKWEIVQKGRDIAILSFGSMFETSHQLWKKLSDSGYEPKLINARFAKPICPSNFVLLEGFRHIFTLEENVASGGFGQGVLAGLNAQGSISQKVHNFAISDTFLPHGTRQEVLKFLKLNTDSIFQKIMEVING
ncbi:MAG: 1-deoxy-D-xylulose-5-phosphate synthase [Defluviitaleaceae bacterium]|nr:1-deoxy-D-xylulose-5-phosphate synthase [Defluviitaleaceae bacterium]